MTREAVLHVIYEVTDRWQEGPPSHVRCEELADAITAYLADGGYLTRGDTP